MQVEKVNSNKNFNGFFNNKMLLKTLEFASDNGALFAAGTSTVLSTVVRPIAILSTPKADKENKHYACAKSIASSVMNFILTAIITSPIINSIQNIQEQPKKFLTQNTINTLKGNNKTLAKSAPFLFATQIFKLGSTYLTTLPKAFLTCALIPPIMSLFFKNKKAEKQNVTFNGYYPLHKQNHIIENISKGIGGILNIPKVQNFLNKYNDTNFAQHMFNINDILATGLFAKFTLNNTNIKENKKKTLIHNATIMTAISIIGGYFINNILKKPTDIFIDKIKKYNANSPKLEKYIMGAKIAKPAIILGIMYYALAPVFATMLAEITSKGRNNAKNN